MKLRKLIEEYIEKAKLMQVATSRNNRPWACSVYFAYDDKWNLYWISLSSARHSKEIEKNKKVAGTIVLPHKHGDEVRGLQFEGVAKVLKSKNEISSAMEYYAKRFGVSGKRVKAIIENTDGHLCYVVRPKSFVLFDTLNYPNDSRQEYKL
ncbi:MAG: hypothetical protein ACD_50C00231G0011 [uncultured bacterium]|nr:MAG: hypothetical protein ACD_50C00231G0011 [uncultured bacterium]OGH14658.1 MAG: hypothetical protein A2687_00575 [Candidatus Levybacteria bacterium RIFCSPHIGHO2_01_FULL_38_26]